MTLDQIQALTDEEIRFRVAEILGTHTVTVTVTFMPFDGGKMTHVTDKRGRIRAIRQMNDGPRVEEYPPDWIAPPNYPADLNACREMAMTLSGFELRNYRQQLDMICGNDIEAPIAAIDATARQRCEAFLAVMGDFAR